MKIFTCPECKFRKFESINALNVHIGKSHSVNYRISIINNKPVVKLKELKKPKNIQLGEMVVILRILNLKQQWKVLFVVIVSWTDHPQMKIPKDLMMNLRILRQSWKRCFNG